MIVKVTQYYRPDGRKKTHEIEVSDECKEKYQEIISCGARLTAEQLMDGVVSQTIETVDGDYDIILTRGNDPSKNKEALEKMIMRFDKDKFNKWEAWFEDEKEPSCS